MTSLKHYIETLKLLKYNKIIKNYDEFWLNSYIDSYYFIKVLRYWKINLPSKIILEDFKKQLNISTCHSYPTIYKILINHNIKKDYNEIFNLIFYFGFNIKNIYFNKYTILDLLYLHIIYVNDVINLIKEEDLIKEENLIKEEDLIKGKKNSYYLKQIARDYNFFDNYYYNMYNYIADLNDDYDDFLEETYFDQNFAPFYRINEINNFYNYTIYYTLDSLDKTLINNSENKKDLFDKINYIEDPSEHPQLLFSLIIDFENRERNLRIIKNLKKLGFKFDDYIYKFFHSGNTIENYNYYKNVLETIIDIFIKGLANQIIFRAVKNALDDKYILSKLRYNIEETKFKILQNKYKLN